MARKSRNEEDVEAYRHETEKRKNVVPVGLASYDTSTPKHKKYEYDPHLDPQLEFLTSAGFMPFKPCKEKRIAVKPLKVITLDSLFARNDQLKTNTVLQMRDAGIDFKTI